MRFLQNREQAKNSQESLLFFVYFLFLADLACVDNLGATAWDYAGAKQLHYCMLIIASYIRQRAREQESANSSQNLNSMLNEGIGIEQLQVWWWYDWSEWIFEFFP